MTILEALFALGAGALGGTVGVFLVLMLGTLFRRRNNG